MADGGAGPAVRVWEILGVDVDDGTALAIVRDDVFPRIKALPGYLGGYVLVDRERSALIGFSFWEDVAAMEASAALSGQVGGAVEVLTSGQMTIHGACEVLVADAPALDQREAVAFDA